MVKLELGKNLLGKLNFNISRKNFNISEKNILKFKGLLRAKPETLCVCPGRL